MDDEAGLQKVMYLRPQLWRRHPGLALTPCEKVEPTPAIHTMMLSTNERAAARNRRKITIVPIPGMPSARR